ncbi:MAG: polysaccharide pyruvyl transferase family protein [Jatrophihabitantaceae bacterium]
MPTDPQGPRSPRLLVAGDVGSVAEYHVGDDAMLFGLLAAAEHAGIDADWTVVSASPQSAAARFGHPAAPTFGFEDCADETGRSALLAELDSLPAGAPGPGQLIRQLMPGAAAVLIAGGGNLSGSWPALVYERVALSRSARRLGVPVVLTGQSIGPRFGPEVRPLVAELLCDAAMVGVRERWSHALAQLLGVPSERLVLADDDAVALCGEAPAGAPQDLLSTDPLSTDPLSMDAPPRTGDVEYPRSPFIAVTLNDLGDVALRALAVQLAEHSHLSGAGVVLVPHAGDLGGAPVADVAASHRVAAAFDARLAELGGDRTAVVAPLPSVPEAIEYCRRAELVISSRYHPVVFAGSCRTPMLFLHQDDYTAMKGIGALDHYGMTGWRMSVSDAAGGRLLSAAAELWQQRRRLGAQLPASAGEQARGRLGLLLTRLVRGEFTPPDQAPRPWWSEPRMPNLVELSEAELSAALSERSALRQQAEEAERYALSLQEQAERHEPYVRSLLRRAEIAEQYAASLLSRAEAAEQHATALEARLGQG